jgi:cyclin-dependent kinase 12/13
VRFCGFCFSSPPFFPFSARSSVSFFRWTDAPLLLFKRAQTNPRPPELLLGADRYGPEVDAWSVGCILAELLGRKPIFPGANEPDQLGKIFSVLGFPREEDWPGVSSLEFYGSMNPEGHPRVGSGGLERWCRQHGVEDAHAIDLLSRLLSLDPRKRLSARDAATHDYFYESPRACYPHELPKVDDSHELGVKKRAAGGGG